MSLFSAIGVRLIKRPGAERVAKAVPDLTTGSSRDKRVHPDALAVVPPRPFWPEPKGPVPGIEITGGLPDDLDTRLVIRIPKDWNGTLVAASVPGYLSERANDIYWSDFVLQKGCAFASMDKGAAWVPVRDRVFVPMSPANHIRFWFGRLKALALLAAKEAEAVHGRQPARCYAVGISSGGFLARKAVEESPHLFDGAVDVSGVFWRASGPNLLQQLPRAFHATGRGAVDFGTLEEIGFRPQPGHAELYSHYRSPIWELVLATALHNFDPEFRGDPKEYRFEARPESVGAAIAEIENTGKLKSPLISVFGDADPLLAPRAHFDGYAELVRVEGKAELHRLRQVKNGSHLDIDRGRFPFLEPLMPAAHAAFDELARWVEAEEDQETPPPASPPEESPASAFLR